MPAQELTVSTPIAASGLCTAHYAAELETALGLKTIGDLLTHYPRRYEDRAGFLPIGEVASGQSVTICGVLSKVEAVTTRSRLSITKAHIADAGGVATLIFFNHRFLKKQLEKHIGRRFVAYGKASINGKRVELTEVEWELIEGEGDEDDVAVSETRATVHTGRIVPIYPLAEGVKQQRLRRLIWDALQRLSSLDETLPAGIIRSRSLMGRGSALHAVHAPESIEQVAQAKRRLAYEGLFGLQIALSVARRDLQRDPGIAFTHCHTAARELSDLLPFSLTNAQRRAIDEICSDMTRPVPMNRLLQGDVGSGKTVVAMAALLGAVRSGYQAAIMAPTEILAEQHHRSIAGVLERLDIATLLLTGSSHTPKAKEQALESVARGEYAVVVGTHALIQGGVRFKRLGLAVIDEQHRFGVLQRAKLRGKGIESAGLAPDILVMTATPIPRTLTLTLYGDLDVTVIDELPPGRMPVRTHWKYAEQRASVYDGVRKLIAQGRQAYVICALVSESEKLQARAATALADHLSREVFPQMRIGLLHGQMKAAEKEAAMQLFRDGRTDILVSTTVIEVGVDVPNASVMVIEDADRFGLAQLHQLRGRVGRGSAQSYCILIADPKSNAMSERLAVIERSNDGFEIAQADLEMRGPGEFFGTKQSGIEMLPFAEVCSEGLILDARSDADAIIAADPELSRREHATLRDAVARRTALREQALQATN